MTKSGQRCLGGEEGTPVTIVCGLHETRLWQEVGRWLIQLGEESDA